MSSPERIAANQKNAQKSTGPTTESGKLRSSRNAVKHGLTAKEIVLPNEDAGQFKDRLADWNDYFQPRDPSFAASIKRAVSADWKLDRITVMEKERLSEKVRHAVDRYDFEREKDAEEIGQRLVFEPIDRTAVPQTKDPLWCARVQRRVDDNPAVLSKQMELTAQGARWKLAQWVEIKAMFETHFYLHYPEKLRAIRLLGKHPEDVVEDLTVQKIMLASYACHPGTGDSHPDKYSFQDECFQTKMGLEGRPMWVFQVGKIKLLKPKDHIEARHQIFEVMTAEIARLTKLIDGYLGPLDDLDRAGAQKRAMFDDSKEGMLLHRYEGMCQREFHKAVAEVRVFKKAAELSTDWHVSADPDEAPERNEANAEIDAEEAVTPIVPGSPLKEEPVIEAPRPVGTPWIVSEAPFVPATGPPDLF